MKPQKLQTPGELRQAFEQYREKHQSEWSANNLAKTIRDFSAAIAGLHEAGIPVSVDIQAFAAEDAFVLARRHIPQGTISVDVFGMLQLGSRKHLFCFLTAFNKKPDVRLYLSAYDYTCNGLEGKLVGTLLRSDIQSKEFNVTEDEQALAKFQEFIVFLAARDSVLAENDEAGVFNNDGRTVILKKTPKPG